MNLVEKSDPSEVREKSKLNKEEKNSEGREQKFGLKKWVPVLSAAAFLAYVPTIVILIFLFMGFTTFWKHWDAMDTQFKKESVEMRKSFDRDAQYFRQRDKEFDDMTKKYSS